MATGTVPTEYDENGNAIGSASGNADGSQSTPDPNQSSDPTLDEIAGPTAIQGDWRVKLELGADATYLYKDPLNNLLAPLAYTNGVIFPYTPTVNVNYNAAYDATSPTHTNYPLFSYTKSSIDNITIACDFTAQDTYEANYLLAVIHFFKSLTKMFYGQDKDPAPGTPPPVVFLYGLGFFQFGGQPLVVNNFTYNLPNNVDYIRAGGYTTTPVPTDAIGGENDGGTPSGNSAGTQKGNVGTTSWVDKARAATGQAISSAITSSINRLAQGAVAGLGSVASSKFGKKLLPGGVTPGSASIGSSFDSIKLGGPAAVGPNGAEPTWVPTQIQLQINCLPVLSRYKQRNFSYASYANGSLANKGYW